MPPAALTCTFNGTAAEVHVRGEGPAMLADPAAFSGPQVTRVELGGATVGPLKASAGSPIVLERPAHLELVDANPDGAPYEATWRAGPPVLVTIDGGGKAAGLFRGAHADAPICAGQQGCNVTWSGGAKTIVLHRAGSAPVTLTGELPFGEADPRAAQKPKLLEVTLRGVVGELKCQDGTASPTKEWIDGQSLVFSAGPHATLALDPMRLEAKGIGVHLMNDAPPSRSGGGDLATYLPAIASLTAALVGLVALGVILARRRAAALAALSMAGDSAADALAGPASTRGPLSMGPPSSRRVSLAPGDYDDMLNDDDPPSSRRLSGPPSSRSPSLAPPSSRSPSLPPPSSRRGAPVAPTSISIAPRLPPGPVEVFCAYSSKDDALRAELQAYLTLLRQSGVIGDVVDQRIEPGTEWLARLDERIDRAGLILFLVSPDFLASDYGMGAEMKRALERREMGAALVIPIVLRPCRWHTAPFARLQALPSDARPVKDAGAWPTTDAAFDDVTRGLERAIRALRS